MTETTKNDPRDNEMPLFVKILLTGCFLAFAFVFFVAAFSDINNPHYLFRLCRTNYQNGHNLFIDSKSHYYFGVEWRDAVEVREQDIETICPKY